MEQTTLLTSAQLLDHWQAHRRLTRRTINAFPETTFFEHSIGGMRSFSKIKFQVFGIKKSKIYTFKRNY